MPVGQTTEFSWPLRPGTATFAFAKSPLSGCKVPLPSVRRVTLTPFAPGLQSRDMRTTSFVSDAHTSALLGRLQAGDQILARPSVRRIGPPESVPWFGSLHVTRVRVQVKARRTSAAGWIDVMPVGAGSTEVRIRLEDTAHWARLGRGRRRLGRLAADVQEQLLQKNRSDVRVLSAAPDPRGSLAADKSRGRPAA